MNVHPESVEIEGATAPNSTTPEESLQTGQNLEWQNLNQEVTWLYEDVTKINNDRQYLQTTLAGTSFSSRLLSWIFVVSLFDP